MTVADPIVSYAGRRAIYPLFAAFAASCLVATLATDITYWKTADYFWVDFSDWLVSAGFVSGLVALVIGLIESFAIRTPVIDAPTWPYGVALFVALVLAFFDMMVHTRDVWTSVVPWGLVLSALCVFVLLVAAVIRRVEDAPVASGVIVREEEIA